MSGRERLPPLIESGRQETVSVSQAPPVEVSIHRTATSRKDE